MAGEYSETKITIEFSPELVVRAQHLLSQMPTFCHAYLKIEFVKMPCARLDLAFYLTASVCSRELQCWILQDSLATNRILRLLESQTSGSISLWASWHFKLAVLNVVSDTIFRRSSSSA